MFGFGGLSWAVLYQVSFTFSHLTIFMEVSPKIKPEDSPIAIVEGNSCFCVGIKKIVNWYQEAHALAIESEWYSGKFCKLFVTLCIVTVHCTEQSRQSDLLHDQRELSCFCFLSNRPLQKMFKLTNKGRRHQQLMWSTDGFSTTMARTQQRNSVIASASRDMKVKVSTRFHLFWVLFLAHYECHAFRLRLPDLDEVTAAAKAMLPRVCIVLTIVMLWISEGSDGSPRNPPLPPSTWGIFCLCARHTQTRHAFCPHASEGLQNRL